MKTVIMNIAGVVTAVAASVFDQELAESITVVVLAVLNIISRVRRP